MSKTTALVMSAVEQALFTRRRTDTRFTATGLVHHSDAGSQYTSIAFTTALVEAGIAPSIGTVGDALDNALMESTIGLYKTELIDRHRRTWTGPAEVETETAGWAGGAAIRLSSGRNEPDIRSLWLPSFGKLGPVTCPSPVTTCAGRAGAAKPAWVAAPASHTRAPRARAVANGAAAGQAHRDWRLLGRLNPDLRNRSALGYSRESMATASRSRSR